MRISDWSSDVCSSDLIVTRGQRREICGFYEAAAARLRAAGIAPLHRKAGLRPHITLGYDACAFASFDIAAWWLPEALLPIESHVGKGRHVVLSRLPLHRPPQASSPFDDPPPPPPPYGPRP